MLPATAIERTARPLDPPCKACGSNDGILYPHGQHMRLDCAQCGAYVKFVRLADLGMATRTVRTRADIKPSTRARILERDNYACSGCGAKATAVFPLHVGHMLSVEDATALRADGVDVRDDDLDSDFNYVTTCSECNSGQEGRSLLLRTAYFILRANIRRAGNR